MTLWFSGHISLQNQYWKTRNYVCIKTWSLLWPIKYFLHCGDMFMKIKYLNPNSHYCTPTKNTIFRSWKQNKAWHVLLESTISSVYMSSYFNMSNLIWCYLLFLCNVWEMFFFENSFKASFFSSIFIINNLYLFIQMQPWFITHLLTLLLCDWFFFFVFFYREFGTKY